MSKQGKKKATRQSFPIWGWAVIAVVILAAVGLLAFQLINSGGSTALPAEITVSQASEKRDQGAFILDVREPSEWTSFHIPGATLIPLGQLPNRLAEVPRDKEVVVVCRTGHRSQQGRDILLQAGFKQVTSMAGGVTQWQTLGLPIATGQ